MKRVGTLLGPHVESFFVEHLVRHKRCSPQTVASMRDSFRLLLEFLRERTGTEPAALRITDMDVSAVLAFLEHVEEHRGNSVRSRNIRLSAIRSFFRVVALRDPESLGLTTRILAIPMKRQDKKLVGYLTREEMDAILATPDRTQWLGRRDYALLLTLYNTGARVSEMTSLKREQVRFGAKTYIELLGKGRKERPVPLWPHTVHVLESWFGELKGPSVFPNARGREMARDGVEYILHGAVQAAMEKCPSLLGKRVSPHSLRHASAYYTTFQSSFILKVIALDWAQSTAVYGRDGPLPPGSAQLARAGPLA